MAFSRFCFWCYSLFDDFDAWQKHVVVCGTGTLTQPSNPSNPSTGTPCECSSNKGDPGDPGTFLLEVEYDDGSPWAFNPQGVVCDGDGQPTTKTVEIDHILVPIFCLPPTGWDKLKALTHEESLARVARDAETGLPTVQMLTFWEYRNLYPDGMPREEYGVSQKWRFEYDGTEWLPVECVDQTGGFEDGSNESDE